MTPDLATFRALFPELAATSDPTVQLWLDDAVEELAQGAWGVCYAKAVLYLAAHNIALANARAASAVGGVLPQAGVLQSGSEEGISFAFADKGTAGKSANAQWLAQSPYGDAFAALARRCLSKAHLSW